MMEEEEGPGTAAGKSAIVDCFLGGGQQQRTVFSSRRSTHFSFDANPFIENQCYLYDLLWDLGTWREGREDGKKATGVIDS